MIHNSKFIVTNFAYGNGPYLRTTELALAFNRELEKSGHSRMKIIVPLVYGDKQKRIMQEEFGDRPEIIFDEKLGDILRSVFYAGGNFQDYLKKWAQLVKEASAKAHEYLAKTYGKDIVVELSRSPRLRYNIAPAYFTSFAYLSEIYERSRLKDAAKVADWVERDYKIHCLSYPGTFAFLKDRQARYKTEVETPPIMKLPKENNEKIDSGIFITVSGISGLENLYVEAGWLGMKIYTNDSKAIPGGIKALPDLVANSNIKLHFARSGWGSVYLSLFSGTPMIVPEYDPSDDPEIKFNNQTIEKLGIGIIYRGQSLEQLLKESELVKENMRKVQEDILKRWGTLDGNQYCAKIFAKDFFKR